MKTKSPEISIIVPVYNVEKYLAECVNSILLQTFRNIEVILVDDGSPDRCGKICDFFAEKDERVKTIHQANSGLSCARNAGVKAALGRYICFVDSDDIIAPNYCETMYNILDGTDYDFCMCSAYRFEDGTVPHPEKNIGPSYAMSNSELLELQLLHKSEFGVWNKMYRRELFHVICFMPNRIHEDVIWSADLAWNLHNGIVVTPKPLYYYRQRKNSITYEWGGGGRCSADFIFAGEYLLKIVEEHFPRLKSYALKYAISFPWSFVDKIYIHHSFKQNRQLLKAIQVFLKRYLSDLKELKIFNDVILKRMSLFQTSKILYSVNAYTRLIRVTLYNKILKKDAYTTGHGI